MNQSEPPQKAILDGLLSDWHAWSAGYSVLPTCGACAMFKDAKSPKHWETTADIDDAAIHKSTMDALDFAILGDKRGQGGLIEPYRAAVTTYARNLVVRVSVFNNPRLPKDPLERAAITGQGIQILSNKLKIAGVL